jgi:hypothetical protein
MKKISILVLFAFILFANKIDAQILTNGNVSSSVLNSNVLIDGSTNYSVEVGAGPNVGKGIIVPSVDLVNFAFDLSFADGSTFPTYFDGMVVYNRATGNTSITGNNPSTTTAVTPGFYYFSNPNGATNGNVTAGRWIAIGGGTSKFVDGTPATTAVYTAGNVGIGTDTPDASAILDISSTTKGIVFPRMTTTERDLIATPTKGLTIYNTTTNTSEVNTGTSLLPVWSNLRTAFQKYTYKNISPFDSNGEQVITDGLRLLFKSNGDTKDAIDNQYIFRDNGTFVIGNTFDGTDNIGLIDRSELGKGTLSLTAINKRSSVGLNVINGESGLIAGSFARGNYTNKTGIFKNDNLIRFSGSGYTDNNTYAWERVLIKFVADEDFTSTVQNTRIDFETTNGTSLRRALTVTGIGTKIAFDNTAPDKSAILEVSSTTQGFLPPRMTNAQFNAITSPAEGLVVYCLDCNSKGLRVFNGQSWANMVGDQVPVNTLTSNITHTPSTFGNGSSVTFSITNGSWSGSPTSFTYQWFKNDVPITGQTSANYTNTSISIGNYFCLVTAINSVGSSTSNKSNIISVSSSAPINTILPAITQEPSVLVVSTGTWTDSINFEYQWKKDGNIISGATNATYNIQDTDYNSTFVCDVKATNNIGSLTVSSNEIKHMIGSGSGIAFSLRKVSPNATIAIKVRRSSDNTSINIGFDSSGNLDETALTTFIGASNGFIETWYDQSTNDRHLNQLTLTKQPQIASNGVIFKLNNKPVIRFNGANILTNNSPWMHDNGKVSVFSVLKGNTTANSTFLTESSSNNNNDVYSPISTGASNALTVFMRGSMPGTLIWTPIQTNVFNNVFKSITIEDSGSSLQSTNGSIESTIFNYNRGTTLGSLSTLNNFNIGAWNRTSEGSFWSGDVSEIIAHKIILPVNLRNSIKASEISYFGL